MANTFSVKPGGITDPSATTATPGSVYSHAIQGNRRHSMGDVIPFGRKPAARKSTLCQSNHHKWNVVKDAQFDVSQGKLVTVERCARCGKTRNRLT